MRYRARRVIVKARVVKLKGVESQAIAARLRYLQREGVTLDGNRGHAYSATDDQADAKDFFQRGREDRHQFRFIVAAEDGVALGDLKPFTRDLMAQMEKDLDTTLDWVAVDHYNTGPSAPARATSSPAGSDGKASWRCSRSSPWRSARNASPASTGPLLDEAHDGRVDLRISPHQSYLVRANRHLLISRLDRLPAASSTWRTAYAGRRTGSPRCCWRGRM